MGSPYTIVAIPRQDDYAWRVSSEKVPHVTLLVLNDQQNKLVEITNYVQHVVDTCLEKFGLSVKSRGMLGPKEADVLFFDEYSVKQLEQVRTYMLEDQNIFMAYQNVDQFDQWTPHLTLGYPATPAKPDPRDYPGIDWINFDKIALWTGDYQGVEFPLKPQNDNMVRMSDAGAQFLAHFGVKGMHWGIRRDAAVLAGRHAEVAATKLKADPTKKTNRAAVKTAGGLHKVSNKDLKAMLDRMDMERRYTQAMNEDAARRRAGLKAVGKFLEAAGKILVPVVVGVAANHYAGTYRTTATSGRVIEGTTRAIGA